MNIVINRISKEISPINDKGDADAGDWQQSFEKHLLLYLIHQSITIECVTIKVIAYHLINAVAIFYNEIKRMG